MKTKIVRAVPQWAVQYIEYGKDPDLASDDVEMIKAFLDDLASEKLRLLSPLMGSENEYENYPAFGYAGSTVDYIAEVIPSKWEVRFSETMECVVLAEGYTKKEARENAEKYMAGGCLNWRSQGIKFKSCRPAGTEVACVKEGDVK